MKQESSLERTLALTFSGLLLLLSAPQDSYSQESITASKTRDEIAQLLKDPSKENMAALPQNLDQLDNIFPSPSLHGFFMLGKDNVMLYHSSAFESKNHPYQMIFKVTIEPGIQADEYRYWHDLAHQHDWAWITHNSDFLNPSHNEQFTLPHLHAGGVTEFIGNLALKKRHGTEYLHNFIKEARITIERIMYFRRYDLSADYPETLSYLLFGIDNEVYMAHYLTKRSATGAGAVNALAFDDLVRVNRPAWLTGRDDLLESVIEVKVPSVSVSSLPTSSPLSGTVNLTVYGDSAYAGSNFSVQVAYPVWFDTTIVNELPHSTRSKNSRGKK